MLVIFLLGLARKSVVNLPSLSVRFQIASLIFLGYVSVSEVVVEVLIGWTGCLLVQLTGSALASWGVSRVRL
jgi:hypothetical protein